MRLNVVEGFADDICQINTFQVTLDRFGRTAISVRCHHGLQTGPEIRVQRTSDGGHDIIGSARAINDRRRPQTAFLPVPDVDGRRFQGYPVQYMPKFRQGQPLPNLRCWLEALSRGWVLSEKFPSTFLNIFDDNFIEVSARAASQPLLDVFA